MGRQRSRSVFLPGTSRFLVSPIALDYVGRYRLLNLLRVGKTCQIWEAISEDDGGRFALKVLLQDYVQDRQEIELLRHEYQVGRDLDHPRVIRHFAFGREKNNVYLAMELFQAANLKQLIQQGTEELAPLVTKISVEAA